ncbi:MAG: TerB family tellurite resistance protein [Bacteroidales bacterium]|nr:TerB family tellurite resistance protein [Bacteroidales bacterium]
MSKNYAKWIGGGLGWALGGPIGGILGFIFGSMFDGMQSGAYEYKNIPYSQDNNLRTKPGDFNVSLIILSAAVMKADGRIMKSELNYVRSFFIRQFGVEESKKNIKLLQEILKQNFNIKDVASQVRQYMDYSSILQLVHYLFGISAADGQIHPKEIEMINTISIYLGLNAAEFNSIKAMFVKDTDSAYKILEITPDASDEDVKKAYRKMALKYHPDKVSHLGADIQKAAKEKFQTLNAAYETIKKQRGIK